MPEKYEKLKEIVENSGSIVFFGGAGVSTESGIPDFRGVDGLYSMKYKYPPEEIISRSFFDRHPREFFEFYRDKLLLDDSIKPSRAHLALAKLERAGKLKAVVTQNIDGLHQLAGSQRVYELHGSVKRNYCMKCRRFYSDKEIRQMPLVPVCECGGVIKPDVVLYEEGLDGRVIEKSIEAIENCDALIVAGTSLSVYPAAAFINYYRGNKLVIINKTPTPRDAQAHLLIRGSVGEALEYAVKEIQHEV